MHAEVGAYGFGRGAVRGARRRSAAATCSRRSRPSTNDGPWTVPDAYRKINGVLRYTQGDSVNGFSLTAMGYHGKWNATEASPDARRRRAG